MFCENCGAKLEEGMLFCMECGHKVETLPEVDEEQTIILPDEEKTIIYEKKDSNSIEESGQELNNESKEVINAEQEVTETANAQDNSENATEAVVPAQKMQVGTPMEASRIRYCHNCGTANAESDAFCYSCGASFTDKKPAGKKFNVSSKLLKILAGAAGVILLVSILVIVFGGNSKKNALIYLKDNEIMQNLKGENYIIGDSAYEDEETNWWGSIQYETCLSADGKMLFYPQDYANGSYDLYYKKLDDVESEGEKIDSEVYRYTVLDNNKVVYCKDNSENKLYISDLNDKEKIASEVVTFKVSSDQQNVWWLSEDDGKMYVCDLALKEDKVKLDSEVTSMVHVSDDLNEIIYVKDDSLYYIADCGEKEKIDSDVTSWSYAISGDKTEIYYYVEDDEASFSAQDIIDDDYAQADAALTEPDITDYQTVEIKPSFWGDKETVVTNDEYYVQLDKYNEKLERDYLREYMAQNSISMSNSILYRYVIGEESEKFDEGIMEGCSGSSNVYLYQKLNMDKIEKIKMSDLLGYSSEYEIEEKLQESLRTGLEVCLVKNGAAVTLDIDFEEYNFEGYVEADNADKSECYIALYENSDSESDDNENVSLFRINYAEADVSMELVTDEYSNIELVTSGNVYYVTEAKDGVGELYCNDDKIDSDVSCYSVDVLADGTGILYITDPDDEYSEGTLNIYKSGESVRIADDVSAYDSNESGNVAYLCDYNFEKYRGDLKVYNGKDSELIDSDVVGILYY